MNTVTHLQSATLQQQLDSCHFLTDGGMETDLIFNRGRELPCFAAFTLLASADGQQILRDYYRAYLDLAAAHNSGFILESPTWRANPDWGARLGHDLISLADINRQGVALLLALRADYQPPLRQPLLISGNLGPRGDGYVATHRMSSTAAQGYHAWQIAVLAEAGANLVSAYTLNYSAEALGIVLAAQAQGIAVVISFTLEVDGCLPSGETLAAAIAAVDEGSQSYPLYYMINCAHPSHVEPALTSAGGWKLRIRGMRGNASRCSHAELDAATALDAGNPLELGADYRRLQQLLPALRVYGGCCGTDLRHVQAIASACLHS